MTNGNEQDGTEVVQTDAREFGQHVRQGGWRLGLLVARNVEKGEGNGRPPSNRYDCTGKNQGKVSANKFAELSGVSRPKVVRYLEAWNRAADQNIVPQADTLTPGTDINIDVDTLPAWTQFYETVNRGDNTPPRDIAPSIEQITAAVKANPMIAEAVSEHIEPTAEFVTKAMRANPEIAKAARDEGWEITKDATTGTTRGSKVNDSDQPAHRMVSDERADIVALAMKIRSARILLDDAVDIARRVEGAEIAGLTDSIRQRCDLLDATLQSESFDTQLTALLESEAGL